MAKKKTRILSTKEHMKEKGMWLGSLKCLKEIEMFVLRNGEFVKELHNHVPALDKLIDEIVVNATDHYISNQDKVKNIYIEAKKNMISVKNDGPGIPLYVIAVIRENDKIRINNYENMEEALEYEEDAIKSSNLNVDIKWNPHILADCPFSGDNHIDKNKNIHIRGGINGVGMKLVNYNSSKFIIETISDGTKYVQSFYDNADRYDEPEITECDGEEYTKISFLPNYKELGYDKIDFKIIKKVVETRAYHAAVYVPKINVYFNGKLIPVKSLQDIVKMHIPEDMSMFSTIIKPKRPAMDEKKYNYLLKKKKQELSAIDWNWEICITPALYKRGGSFTVINGVFVQTGAHIAYFRKMISALFRENVEPLMKEAGKKKFQMSYIVNNIDIYIRGTMDSPEFTAQNKKDIDLDAKKLEGYQFTKKDIRKLWSFLKPIMEEFMYVEMNKMNKKSTKTRSDKYVSKYTKAKFAGPRTTYKKRKKRYLFIPEGDSAEMLLSNGFSDDNIKDWNMDYCGIFSIQGVPMNARKNCAKVFDRESKKWITVQKPSLKNNERLQLLMQVTGLDPSLSYKTKEERDTLKYDVIIAAVDQDDDGKGNIFTLLLGFISLFWPELVKRRFVCRMNTPVIIAIDKKINKQSRQSISFYSILEYDRWVLNNDPGKYDFKYIKGLAGTDKPAIKVIFETLSKRMYEYTLTNECEEYFDIYLGEDPEKRKIELKDDEIYEIPLDENGNVRTVITCKEHLQGDCKSFQRYNIRRSLPHAMDGLNPSRRKVLTCARMMYGVQNKKQKVVDLASGVVRHMAYIHGEASLCQTIIKMTQSFPGSNILPLLKSDEIGFGDRKFGGTKTGQPRYLKLNLNKQISDSIFPKEDDYLLKYVFSEGERCEPLYYVPIIPMAVVESIHLPAHGWAVCSWARNIDEIFDNVERMIKNKKPYPMDVSTHNWNGDIYQFNNSIYSVGKYTYDKKKNKIIITELPHGVVSQTLFEGNRKTEERKLKEREKLQGGKIDYAKVDFKEEAQKILLTGRQKKMSKKAYDKLYNEDAQKAHNIDPLDISTDSYTIIDKPVVKGAWNKTNDNGVKIEIDLYKGGYEYIQALHSIKNTYWDDPVIEYFHLRKILHDNLSFLNKQNRVVVYNKYVDIVSEWFDERKKLYSQRIERNKIILKLQIKLLEEKNRFAENYVDYDIIQKSVEILEKKLDENKFKKFDHVIIGNPKYIPVNKIVYEATENPKNVSYDYIKNMKVSTLAKNAIVKRKEEIQKLKAELKKLEIEWKYFPGDKLWLDELKALRNKITNGMKHGWLFNEPKIVYQ